MLPTTKPVTFNVPRLLYVPFTVKAFPFKSKLAPFSIVNSAKVVAPCKSGQFVAVSAGVVGIVTKSIALLGIAPTSQFKVSFQSPRAPPPSQM